MVRRRKRRNRWRRPCGTEISPLMKKILNIWLCDALIWLTKQLLRSSLEFSRNSKKCVISLGHSIMEFTYLTNYTASLSQKTLKSSSAKLNTYEIKWQWFLNHKQTSLIQFWFLYRVLSNMQGITNKMHWITYFFLFHVKARTCFGNNNAIFREQLSSFWVT
jgi:hypothetical protein